MEMAIRASKQEILSKYGECSLSFVRERHGIFWYSAVVGEYQLTANVKSLQPAAACRAADFIECGNNFSIVKKDTGAFLYVQTRS